MKSEPHESALAVDTQQPYLKPEASTSQLATTHQFQESKKKKHPKKHKPKVSSWRKNPSPTSSSTSRQSTMPNSNQINQHCVIEVASDSLNQTRTTLLTVEAPTGNERAPHGPQVDKWLKRRDSQRKAYSTVYRVARRISLCLDTLETCYTNQALPNSSDRSAYSIYQTALAAESFKRAIGLILFTFSMVTFYMLQSNVIRQPLFRLLCLMFIGILIFIGYIYLILYKRGADERLAQNNVLPAKPGPESTRCGLSNFHFLDLLHLLVLCITIFWTLISIYLYPELGPIMAIIIYIFYTQLSVNKRRLVVLICYSANLLTILLLSQVSTSSTSSNDQLLGFQLTPLLKILFSISAFIAFHIQGNQAQKAIVKQCLKSFNDVKNYEEAKSELETLDRKVMALLERAYPKDIVIEIRDYKLGISRSNNQFQPFCYRSYNLVSILYADIVGFTNISSRCSPQEIVQVLHELVGRFDREGDKYPCLRIKILGDCYYCVSGIPDFTKSHARKCVGMALDMIDILDDLANSDDTVSKFDLKMRVGIHSGRAVCGVLGNKRKQFDVYSNDVRIANYLEQTGTAGKVHISERTWSSIEQLYSDNPNDNPYKIEPATTILSKDLPNKFLKEDMNTYFIALKQPNSRSKLSLSGLDLKAIQLARRPSKPKAAKGSRFKTTANAIMTAQKFFRTIDLPFENLDDSMSDASSMKSSTGILPDTRPKQKSSRAVSEAKLRRTIESRCLNDDTCDVDPLTLRFKSGDSTAYKTSYPIGSIIILVISTICLVILTTVYGQNENIAPYVLPFIISYFVANLVNWHHQEFLARRDFRWGQIAQKDKERLEKLKDCNRDIFYDLLPPHVAVYFLEQPAARKDLYSKSYTCTGVMFANICNYYEYYDEDQINNGVECLRILNETICDFDKILDEEQFREIDKIKTIGATYMTAIGLMPEHEMPEYRVRRPSTVIPGRVAQRELDSGSTASQEDRSEVAAGLRTLAMFFFRLRERLKQNISPSSFYVFQLRAGINLGPVTAGVIAASKPQYDIWGNTVNVASRMESTAEVDKLQITDNVYELLEEFNQEPEFKFTCRGPQKIKGKGEMITYYMEL